MMTFVPYEDFELVARVLDYDLLRQQRYEAWSIYRHLQMDSPQIGADLGIKMWQGHESWLLALGAALCWEWENRNGAEDALQQRFKRALDVEPMTPYPAWLGEPLLHISHRSALLRLDPMYYQELWPGVEPTLPLIWPTD